MSHRTLYAILVLALAAIACGVNISLPKAPTPGPETTERIAVPLPVGEETHLALSFGAGDLLLAPGAKALVEGTATYSITDLKPVIKSEGGNVEIQEGNLQSFPYPDGIKNTWDFKLAAAPMDLAINAGAYKGTYELGGLKLTGLTIKDGAADVNLSFTKPNEADMAVLRYQTGASSVKLTGLANANFATLIFDSGAGNYTLDFSGKLKRDATATISTGVSNMILVVPEGVKARVTVEGGASNVNAGPGWSQEEQTFTQAGSGPALTILVKTGAGNLTLTR
jgi:hypothetical protein